MDIKEMIQENHKSVVEGLGGLQEGMTELKSRVDEIETRSNRAGVTPGQNREDGPEVKAFDILLRKGTDTDYIKSMSTTSDNDGGYAIPLNIDDAIQAQLMDASAMRRLATVKRVPAGYRKLIGVHGLGSGWVGEVDSRPGTDSPQLEAVEPPAGEIYCNASVTQALLDDAAFDVAGWLSEEISDAFTRQEGIAFISGSGTKQPKGFLSYTTSTDDDDARTFGVLKHLETASATAFTADELIGLLFDLRTAYRSNASWLMNSATLAYITKLKNSEGDYLFREAMKEGASGMLLGRPVYTDEAMPDIAAEALPIALGDFRRGYMICDRITRLLRDPYTAKPYVSFYSTKRVSGMLTDSNAIRLLKMKASA
jgi:HK97 family phage major capsid protein